ncbi:MAG: ATP-dependent protease LonB [Theionarchaea archaeon]|nr:MAG: ATP-dependent protease LonB [Theionarchaea archaeon DG-70-1]MBU7030321.1 ATP-dependent protease LonB [Theionarchaea archaeon]
MQKLELVQEHTLKDLGVDFETTETVDIPDLLIDQVIGQEHAVELIRIAARQRRNVLLIGDPGNGKSMLGQAMAELLPREELQDVIAYPNYEDTNTPLIRTVPASHARDIVGRAREEAKKQEGSKNILLVLMVVVVFFLILRSGFDPNTILLGMLIFLLTVFLLQSVRSKASTMVPKVLVDNGDNEHAPFEDATGAHAGALLGDVRHDPFQSGGLGTPAHERVEAGMIHKAHKGVLFIDEISTLKINMQQAILTAMQDKKFAITGQSEMSSGAMVHTHPVPCDFVLVAAGNLETVGGMHPALRSRIRGYGYEIYMNNSMPDTPENRRKIVQFVAQEVVKDGKIPHFTKEAVLEILKEFRRRSGRKGHLSCIFRDLGGLVRSAGDLALKKGKKYVDTDDILDSKKLARTLEHQIADRFIERKKEYQVMKTSGLQIGRVNGLAVIGRSGESGILTPIEAETPPALSRSEGRVIATGKLGKIAREAVANVSALIKKYAGKDMSRFDVHIQFLQTYEGVEGDSASVSIATAVVSALEELPVRQSIAMTGSLSVRGEVLPIGGVNAKIEAAIEAGIKRVLIPYANMGDVMLDKRNEGKVEIVPVKTLDEVIDLAMVGQGKDELVERVRMSITRFENGFEDN